VFHPAATLDDLWSGEMRGVTVGGRRLLLVRVGDRIGAYEDRCAHQGVCLSEGRLEGNEIICRAHEWRYDACTGQGVNPASAHLRPAPVRLQDGTIFVDPDFEQGEAGE
jgi:toluene monooxygenase system ferredoxin subunit